MPRKTRYEIDAERSEPEPGTEAFWRLRRVEASAKKQMLEAQHRKMLIDQMTSALIPQEEVKEMFGRVFAAYRQATREISRRYGPEAAKILQEAERSALRVDTEEANKCKSSASSSGSPSKPTSRVSARSRNSRKKRS